MPIEPIDKQESWMKKNLPNLVMSLLAATVIGLAGYIRDYMKDTTAEIQTLRRDFEVQKEHRDGEIQELKDRLNYQSGALKEHEKEIDQCREEDVRFEEKFIALPKKK